MTRKIILRGWRREKQQECGMETSHSKRENKMKIRREKQNFKWSKRREEENMRFEINYNIKTSDLIRTNLKDKK